MTHTSLDFSEFSRLVEETQGSLRAHVRVLGVRVDFVDDVAQEAFLIAYKQRHQFRKGTNFSAWVRAIARNIVANELRKDARRSRLLHKHMAGTLLEHVDEHADRMDTRAAVAALKECVQALPGRSREMIRRRYEHSQNATALAQHFSMSAVAVRKSLMRIRNAIRECIEGKVGELQP